MVAGWQVSRHHQDLAIAVLRGPRSATLLGERDRPARVRVG